MAMFDERYIEKEFYYGKNPNDFLAEVEENLPRNSRILSLGEGEGRNAVYLAKKGHHVVALDESIVGLEKASAFARENNVSIKTIAINLNDYIFLTEEFDCVLSIWCHLPSDLRKKVHQGIYSTLKKDGFLILEGYTKKQLSNNSGGPKNIDMLYDKAELENELSKFNLKINRELDRNINEGIGHNGMSAVIQILAQKF